ncbi:Crp/Fnr family transcriptional regulator [Flavobacterium sp.]|uniref:Crp/Fnr family transcriptional regulator n=1 Tax=Flavobacterium sp. TaxID=239 RepID=UPI00260267DC|nr:Crp/Fnr family transcriptional regulator [Flavobacterium sp.]MDD3004219.1 Crp/Fnr family transcriptional regulator [Flavobacterium sp.]
MNLLLKNIAKHVTLTPEEEERVLFFTQLKHYKAKTILLHSGEICIESYFILKGILRSYTVDENGVEHVVSFACSEWWMADIYSFLSQRPGQLFIEVNEDAEVLCLTKENQEQLYVEVPKMERYFRILIENSLIANQQRLINNLTFTAEARYDKFSKKFRDILPYLPQKQIASYIGVTPEFFSKMKSRMLRK